MSAIDRDGPACDGSLLYGLAALAFLPDTGARNQFFGEMERAPDLGALERQDLETGRAVVLARTIDNRPTIYLARRLEAKPGHGGLLIGEVFSDYLWGAPERNPLIPTMQLHVVDEANQMLFGSIPGAARLPEPVRHKLGGAKSRNASNGNWAMFLSGGLCPDRTTAWDRESALDAGAERGPGGGCKRRWQQFSRTFRLLR